MDVMVLADTAEHLRAIVGGVMGWCAHNRHELDMAPEMRGNGGAAGAGAAGDPTEPLV